MKSFENHQRGRGRAARGGRHGCLRGRHVRRGAGQCQCVPAAAAAGGGGAAGTAAGAAGVLAGGNPVAALLLLLLPRRRVCVEL